MVTEYYEYEEQRSQLKKKNIAFIRKEEWYKSLQKYGGINTVIYLFGDKEIR